MRCEINTENNSGLAMWVMMVLAIFLTGIIVICSVRLSDLQGERDKLLRDNATISDELRSEQIRNFNSMGHQHLVRSTTTTYDTDRCRVISGVVNPGYSHITLENACWVETTCR